VFGCFGQWFNTAAAIRADLQAAKLPLIDREQNEICFHSLRNSYISFLANSETPARVVQQLARHSDPRLTFATYARSFAETEQTAIKCLPNLGDFCIASSIAKLCENQLTTAYTPERKKANNTVKTALLAESKIAPRGFEPLLPM
jgi:hypothetical protein